MKILATSIVDLKRSAPLRQHWFLKRLSRHHEVIAVCPGDSWKAKQQGNEKYQEGLDLGRWETVYISQKRISPMVQEVTSGGMLSRVLRQNHFDVHLNLSGLIAGAYVTRTLAEKGIPTVYDVADDLPAMTAHAPQIPSPLRGIGKAFAKRLMADTMRLSVRTTFVTANLSRLYPTDRSEVLPNGVDLKLFQPQPSAQLRHDLRLDGAFVVGFVGALRQYVDMEPVFQAVKQLTLSGRNVKMLVVGDEGGAWGAQELAYSYDLCDIAFMGTKPFVKLPEYINAMDVCVMPLRYDNACPLSALQELACGKPVITTRPIEVDCPAVLLAPDAETYRERIAALVDAPNYRRCLGVLGREYVTQAHDWAIITGRMESLLEEVAHKGKYSKKAESIAK